MISSMCNKMKPYPRWVYDRKSPWTVNIVYTLCVVESIKNHWNDLGTSVNRIIRKRAFPLNQTQWMENGKPAKEKNKNLRSLQVSSDKKKMILVAATGSIMIIWCECDVRCTMYLAVVVFKRKYIGNTCCLRRNNFPVIYGHVFFYFWY